MTKYIAKPDTWFDEGTEAKLLSGPWGNEFSQCGLFTGTKFGEPDEEICNFTEFNIVEEEDDD